jgi:hypothetical protein
MGDSYEQKGMSGEAVGEWRRAMTLAGDDELAAVLSSAYDEGGFGHAIQDVAQKRLERLKQRVERDEYVPAIYFARAYVRLGDRKQAFQHLGAACEERNVFALLITLVDSSSAVPESRLLFHAPGLLTRKPSFIH